MQTFLERYRYHIYLHVIVFIWGFTGILGKLITINSAALVWLRMLIAAVGIGVFLLVIGRNFITSKTMLFKSLGVGLIVAAHWICFFEALKVSNVSVTLACLSSASLFVAFIEPALFKRRIIPYEVLLGLLVIAGLLMIFNFEPQYQLGIFFAVLSAFFAALFGTINALLVREERARIISFYEMVGGFLGISIYFLITQKLGEVLVIPSISDAVYLLILGLICTAFAFVVSVEVLKHLSPFTSTISINMEPVYSIILALLIFGDSEKMTSGFYLGATLIMGTIFANAGLKAYFKKKTLELGKNMVH